MYVKDDSVSRRWKALGRNWRIGQLERARPMAATLQHDP
jgi:hypothetical protein